MTLKRVTDADRVKAVLRDRPRDARGIVIALGRPANGANLRTIRVVLARMFKAGQITRVYNDKLGAYVWHLPPQ